MATKLPPLLTERSRSVEFTLLVVVPSVGGLIGGVLLGVNEIAYLGGRRRAKLERSQAAA